MSSSSASSPPLDPSEQHRYPPPQHISSPSQSRRSVNSSNAASDDTLYHRSPHAGTDRIWQKRRRRVNCGLDPLHVVGLIVLAYFVYAFVPFSFPFNRSPAVASRTGNDMVWQRTFTLPSASKGCHLVTPSVEREIAQGLQGVKAGLVTLFIQHTSAALSVNENYDPTVRKDMDMAMDRIVPESLPWKHTDEGPDDSASHTKSSLFGSSITIPITDGRLNLGTWQGIYLCGTYFLRPHTDNHADHGLSFDRISCYET